MSTLAYAAYHHYPPYNVLLGASSSPRNFKLSTSCCCSLSNDPQNRIVLGCGGVFLDFLATVDSYPNPDDKIRTTTFKVQGGGNTGNAMTCAARLGLKPRIISKIADDTQGKAMLEEFEADSVDTTFFVVANGGISPSSYVIVDSQTKTRTSISTFGSPPLVPDDLPRSSLLSALDGARVVYFDGLLHETALVVAREVYPLSHSTSDPTNFFTITRARVLAARQNIPMLVDAESKGEGMDDLLKLAKYAAWTETSSISNALVSMLLKLPTLKFVIVTLGEHGCIMLERSSIDNPQTEKDIDTLLESLNQKKDNSVATPVCFSSSVTKIRAKGIGTVNGRLFVGTAEKIPPSELIDTTGAGDAFIGAVLYAICANMPAEKMLPFACQVAAICCRGLGARTTLPLHADPRLAAKHVIFDASEEKLEYNDEGLDETVPKC
ncbi:hypothetical protein ACFE04_030312 [Oxalis oulophora]